MITASYYGKIRILDQEIEGYVLSDETACLSELGAALLLGFTTRATLDRIASNSWPKELVPFIPKGFEVPQTAVKVTAKSPHKGSEIRVYTAQAINIIARAYSRAYLYSKLRKNQQHIGRQCAILRDTLADAALELVIREACGFIPEVQKTIRRCYQDTIFIYTRELLLNALKQVYPDREDRKYKGLMATCFNYCYKDLLGPELHKKIKKKRAAMPYISTSKTKKPGNSAFAT